MTKKSTEKISIKITYDMWLIINKCYKLENEHRVANNKKTFKNKSEYYNYFVGKYIDALTKAKTKEYEEFHAVTMAKKLKNVNVEGKKCKIINFVLDENNTWCMKHYICKFNGENFNKNVFYIFALYYSKIKSQR